MAISGVQGQFPLTIHFPMIFPVSYGFSYDFPIDFGIHLGKLYGKDWRLAGFSGHLKPACRQWPWIDRRTGRCWGESSLCAQHIKGWQGQKGRERQKISCPSGCRNYWAPCTFANCCWVVFGLHFLPRSLSFLATSLSKLSKSQLRDIFANTTNHYTSLQSKIRTHFSVLLLYQSLSCFIHINPSYHLPCGKRLHTYGTSPFFNGKTHST